LGAVHVSADVLNMAIELISNDLLPFSWGQKYADTMQEKFWDNRLNYSTKCCNSAIIGLKLPYF